MTKNKKSQLFKKLILLAVLPISFELTIIGSLGYLLYSAFEDNELLERSRQIISNCSSLLFAGGSVSVNTVLSIATPSKAFSKLRVQSQGEFRTSLEDALSNMNGKYPADFLEEYKECARQLLSLLNDSANTARPEDLWSNDLSSTSRRDAQTTLMGKFNQDTLQVVARELQDVEKLKARMIRNNSLIVSLFCTGLTINVSLTLTFALFYSLRLVNRLKGIAAKIATFEQGQEYISASDMGDEVDELDENLARTTTEFRRQQQREMAVIDSAADMICTIDVDGRFISVNQVSESLLGYHPTDLIGRSCLTLFADQPHSFRQLLNPVGAFEAQMKRIDGKSVFTRWSVSSSSRNQFSGEESFCIVSDVTAQRNNDIQRALESDRFRALLASIPVGVIEVEDTGAVTYANLSFEKMSGLSQNVVTQTKLGQLISAPLAQENPGKFLLESRDSDYQYFLSTATGAKLPVDMRIHLLAEGYSNLYAINLIDVSDRLRLQITKARFAGVITSRFSQPLRAAQVALRELIDLPGHVLPEKVLQRLEQCLRNLSRLEDLVSELLNVENIDFASVSITPELGKVGLAIDIAVLAVKDFAEKAEVEILHRSQDVEWILDQRRIVQVLVNLLSNSIKFSTPNSKVRVQAYVSNNRLRFEVVDQGPGIEPEVQANLFKPFVNSPRASRTSLKGTGLGLSICRVIVEKHGGQIGVISELGVGTTIWFELHKGAEVVT